MYNLWGTTACVDDMLNVTMNDRLRAFGIMALENYKEDVDLLIRGK